LLTRLSALLQRCARHRRSRGRPHRSQLGTALRRGDCGGDPDASRCRTGAGAGGWWGWI